MAEEVTHDAERHRFAMTVDGLPCELDYVPRPGMLDLVHTGVHPGLRGRGLAARLVEAAVSYARERQLKIRPSCSYVEAWMRRHPEAEDLRA